MRQVQIFGRLAATPAASPRNSPSRKTLSHSSSSRNAGRPRGRIRPIGEIVDVGLGVSGAQYGVGTSVRVDAYRAKLSAAHRATELSMGRNSRVSSLLKSLRRSASGTIVGRPQTIGDGTKVEYAGGT